MKKRLKEPSTTDSPDGLNAATVNSLELGWPEWSKSWILPPSLS